MEIRINYDIKKEYRIITGSDLFTLDRFAGFPGKTLVVTDRNIFNIYSETIRKAIPGAIVLKLKAGGKNKNIIAVKKIIAALLRHHFGRSDLIIGFGGGMIGDLAAFAASVWMRGIGYLAIPTTLLAMIDSSVGGKTAFDYGGIRNLIGTFYPPKMILIDRNILKTLPERELAGGMMEALKMGLIGDRDLWELIKRNDLRSLGSDLDEVIVRSLNVKKRITEADPLDENIRKLLNFGHTIGHAVEALGRGKISHGEAIAYGMIPFTHPALKIEEIIRRYCQLPKLSFSRKKLMEKIMYDKKGKDGFITVIRVDIAGQGYLQKYSFEEIEDLIDGFYIR